MFASNLRYLRKRAGLTQLELAQVLGVSRSTIGMYEKGDREPDFEMLERIADYFNVNMSTLIGDQEKASAAEPLGSELEDYLEMLRTRPECRAFLDTARGATKAEVEENVRFLEALRKAKNNA